MQQTDKDSKLEAIDPARCYPLSVFKVVAGMGRVAISTARRNGLQIRRVGNRRFVLGKDFIAYVAKHGTPEGGSAKHADGAP